MCEVGDDKLYSYNRVTPGTYSIKCKEILIICMLSITQFDKASNLNLKLLTHFLSSSERHNISYTHISLALLY